MFDAPMSENTGIQHVIEDILRRVGDIPPLPVVASKVLAMVNDPDMDIADLVAIIEKDQGLTAKVLRVSNSAFFGLARRIATVREAVVALGLNNIRNQILTLSAYSLMQGEASGYALEAGRLWDHSLCTALCAERLACALDLKRIKDEVFIGGLLHDIGKSVLSFYVGARFRSILRRVDELGESFAEAEAEELGFDHAEVGARVALRWNLPEVLVEIIGDHHHPATQFADAPQVCIVHIADAVASMLGIGVGVDSLEKRLDVDAAALVGFDDRCAQDIMAYVAGLGDLRSYVGTA